MTVAFFPFQHPSRAHHSQNKVSRAVSLGGRRLGDCSLSTRFPVLKFLCACPWSLLVTSALPRDPGNQTVLKEPNSASPCSYCVFQFWNNQTESLSDHFGLVSLPMASVCLSLRLFLWTLTPWVHSVHSCQMSPCLIQCVLLSCWHSSGDTLEANLCTDFVRSSLIAW